MQHGPIPEAPPSQRDSYAILPNFFDESPAQVEAPAVPRTRQPRTRAGVLQPLPRRERLDTAIDLEQASRPYGAPILIPEISSARVALRAMRWFFALVVLGLRIVWDFVRGRRGVEYRAVHVRRMFESIGGTAIKFGQQLSVRVDLLPFEICQELASLLDSVPPFDVAYARERLAAATGRPAGEIVLDPEPIGSASIACVFRGVLPTGERVAVKVRRPGVEQKFMADIRVIDWLTHLAEVTTVVRPDYFKFLRSEIREMFLDELDLRKESTFQVLFKRWAKKDRIDWLTVPDVYPELSSSDVLTTALVEGIPCAEVVEAVERNDQDKLAELAALGIDPKILARQIMVLVFWSRYERPFFHADPHPGNIMFQPGNHIVLLDFGACGVQGRATVDSALEMHRRLVNNDFTGAADVLVATMQPLPYIDVTDLQHRLEHHLFHYYVGAWTKDAEWYERTSAKLWLNAVEISRDLHLPINMDVLRQLRATLLYDTLACRLDGKLHPPTAFNDWRRAAADRTRRRNRKQRDRMTPRSIQRSISALAADSAEVFAKGSYWISNISRTLPVDNLPLMGKGAFFAESILRFVTTVIWLSTVLVGAVAIYTWTSLGRDEVSIRGITLWTLTHPLFTATLLLLATIVVRRVLFRLSDKDRRG